MWVRQFIYRADVQESHCVHIRTWPAVWEVGDDWPNQGEVDIVEGVNNVSPNQATLHTAAGKSLVVSVFSLTSYTTTSFRLYDAHDQSFHGGVRNHMIPAYRRV